MSEVGFIGAGNMGSRMVARLIDAGHTVTVWNRRDDCYDQNMPNLVSRGAKEAENPRACAAGKKVVLTSLTDGLALRLVCEGDDGILSADPTPAILVDLSTISPHESADIAESAAKAGVSFLRCCVVGSVGMAEAGTLTLMASGDKQIYEVADPYLALLGQTRLFVGPGENARFLKLIVNMNILAQMQMLAESAVLGEKGGLDWQQILEVISGSVAGSPFVKNKSQSLIARNYDPKATLDLAHKDLLLAAKTARELDVKVPMLELIIRLQEQALADGYGERDLTSVALWYEKEGVRAHQLEERLAAET